MGASAAFAQSPAAEAPLPAKKAPVATSRPASKSESSPASSTPSAATPAGSTDAAASPDAATPEATPSLPTEQQLSAEEEARRDRQRRNVELFSDEDRIPEEEPGFGWVAFQTFIALGIVILLVYLTLNYGVRRMMGLRGPIGLRGVRLVDVVERVALDQKKALFVVKVAGEYLLVGGSDGGLSLLSKIDPEEVARLQREHAASPPQMSPFLQKLLSRRDGTPPKTG